MAGIRAMRNYTIGALGTAATISDTTLNSTAFASLPSTYSTTYYLPLTLQNPVTGAYEIVYVTAHVAGSNNVTVIRAREGSSAQAWPQNSAVGCNVTLRDILSHGLVASRPADPHVGMRWVDTDTSREMTWTNTAGWQPTAGMANVAELGTRRSNAAIPAGAIITRRGGHKTSQATDSGGLLNIFHATPYPTMTIGGHVVSTNGSEFIGAFSLDNERADGFTVYCWKLNGTLHTSGTVSFYYESSGY